MHKTLIIFTFLFFSIFSTIYSQENIDSLINSVNSMKLDSIKINKANDLVKKLCFIDPDKAMKLAKSTYNDAKKIRYEYGEAIAISRIGWAYDFQNNIDSALMYYNKAIDKHKTLGNEREVGDNLNNIGICYYLRGYYPEASTAYIKTLDLRKQLSDSIGMSKVYNNLGVIHAKLGNQKEALFYHKKSLAIKESLKDTLGIIIALNNAANVNMDLGNYELAEPIIKDAINLADKINAKEEIASGKINLGKCYFNLGEVEKSIKLNKQAIEILKKLHINEFSQLEEAYLYLAKAYFEQKKYSLAIAASDKSLKIIGSENYPIVKAENYDLRWRAFKKLGLLEKSLEELSKKVNLQDTLFDQNTSDAIAKISAKYRLDSIQTAVRNQTENERILRANAEKLQKATEKKNSYLISLVIFFALLLISLGMLFYHNVQSRKRLRAKNELIKKSLEEKETLLKEIHHRVKNNLQFISSMLRIQTRRIPDKSSRLPLEEAQNRIYAMEIIHQKLYRQDDISSISVNQYIQNISKGMLDTYNIGDNKPELILDIDDIDLDIDTLITFGLIINELISNSFKHGFSNKKSGKLKISLKQNDDDLTLFVCDNGKGLPDNFNPKNLNSFGIKMIKALALKLGADLRYFESDEGGTTAEIKIKNKLI